MADGDKGHLFQVGVAGFGVGGAIGGRNLLDDGLGGEGPVDSVPARTAGTTLCDRKKLGEYPG